VSIDGRGQRLATPGPKVRSDDRLTRCAKMNWSFVWIRI